MPKLSLFIFLILFSCGVRQPLDFVIEVDNGNLFVQSQPSGALIYLDGENQNKLTPDTLKNIPSGEHFISVIKEGFKSTQDSIRVTIVKDSLRQIEFILEAFVQTGLLVVETEPSDATLFVDDQPTGKYTPDTLILESGIHTVSAHKNGFNPVSWDVEIIKNKTVTRSVNLEIEQRILLEAFGNVSCVPCVTSAQNLETFRESYPENTFILIEYYANWPAANDPFYLESPQDVDQRVQQDYQIFSLPSLKMNGTTSVDATDYSQLSSTYEQILAVQQSRLAVSISRQKPADSLLVTIEIFDYNDIPSNSDLRLFVAVVEDEIHLSNPPGTNGLKDFNFVFRRFLSSRKGDEISGTEINYAFEWPGWDYANSRVIAFIQDINNKQIIQSSIN